MIQYIEITPKMMWLVDKPGWMVYFIPSTYNLLSRIASVFMFTLVIFFSAGSVTLIISISKYISQMSSTSSRSHVVHTIALRNLILQFIIFSLFLSLPTLIIVTPLLFALDSGTTFFQISESILCSHGLANSIVTIAFNSNFKRAITEHFLWNSLAGIQNSRAGKRQSIIGINQHRPSISLY
uniref:G protein-coupled receptor n=1 Tax=Pristionchus pacificus TaxID=54126 RepID=A0A8R1Z1D3_PRIPA